MSEQNRKYSRREFLGAFSGILGSARMVFGGSKETSMSDKEPELNPSSTKLEQEEGNNQERTEKQKEFLKKMRCTLVLMPHATKKEAEEVWKYLDSSDIISLELTYFSGLGDRLQELSDGKISSDDYMELVKKADPQFESYNIEPFVRTICDLLEGSKKKIILLDPETMGKNIDSGLEKFDDNAQNIWFGYNDNFHHGDLDQAIKYMEDFLNLLAHDAEEYREEVMAQKLERALLELIDDQQLKSKDKIQVSISMGAAHFRLKELIGNLKLFESPVEVSPPITNQKRSELGLLVKLVNEVRDAGRLSKESKEKVLVALFENVYERAVLNLTEAYGLPDSSYTAVVAARELISSKLTRIDIIEICKTAAMEFKHTPAGKQRVLKSLLESFGPDSAGVEKRRAEIGMAMQRDEKVYGEILNRILVHHGFPTGEKIMQEGIQISLKDRQKN